MLCSATDIYIIPLQNVMQMENVPIANRWRVSDVERHTTAQWSYCLNQPGAVSSIGRARFDGHTTPSGRTRIMMISILGLGKVWDRILNRYRVMVIILPKIATLIVDLNPQNEIVEGHP